ncbi:unnamed protein product [Didymodactylos carnosus]|uniref:Uncharacterized protein n=1 Tax=Didymodactylos carnosus TaxID=1234261 RepID=A0A814FQY4_9BILA|nr:unnamed protein product [Didymodactylos carnosus]CAF3761113.1 unnamed protein product [Didymodactylos carnosus]
MQSVYTNKGRLRGSNTGSETTLKLDEYLRLVSCKKNNSIKVYVNGKLELNASIDEDAYDLKERYIYLFKEIDNSNITALDRVRIECKSITFKNNNIDQLPSVLESSTYSLEKFVALPFTALANQMSVQYQ